MSPSSCRGSPSSSARPAEAVSVRCPRDRPGTPRRPPRRSAPGSATPHQPNVSVAAPRRERVHSCRRYGADAPPRLFSVPPPLDPRPPPAPTGSAEEIPAAAASTIPGHRLGPPDRGAQADEAAERMADPDGRAAQLRPRARPAPPRRTGRDARRRRQRPRASVPGQLRHQHAVLQGQRGGDQAPVSGRASEAVDEHHRRPRAGCQVADQRPCGTGQRDPRIRESPAWRSVSIRAYSVLRWMLRQGRQIDACRIDN